MAGDVIDSLSIELNSNATKANKAVDELIEKLGNLANSLTRIDSSGLNGLANGVGKLTSSMQGMKGIGEAKFRNLANGINKLSAIDTAGLNKSASSLYQITKSFGEVGKVGENTKQIATLTTSLSKLGNKGISNAINNLPALATEMKNLMTTLSTAPRVSNNLIQMTNAMAKLTSQGQKASGATKGLTSTFKSYDSLATSSTSKTAKLSSMIGKMYQSFFYVKRGISGIKDAVESSMDYIETLNYFDAAFGQVADTAVKNWKESGYKSAEEYYNSFSERAKKLTSQMSGFNISPTGTLEATGRASLGIDPDQLMNYQATFAQMSSSIGATAEQSLKLSRALTEIGADLASVKNLDFNKAWNDMASGLAGMSRTLDKYGVNIRNVNLQQQLTNLGISTTIDKLNQNEKALLRTIILLNSTKYAWGDLAETINQPANQVRLLQASFQNLSRTIGNIFLPIVAKILPYINGLVIALQRLFSYVGKKLGLDVSELTSSVGDSAFDMSELADGADDVADGLDDASKKAKKLKNNINTIGIDKLNIISKDKDKTDDDDENKGLNNADLSKLNKAFEDAYEKYQKAWDKAFAGVDNKALEIADKITNAFKKGDYKGIGKFISDNLTKALKSINWDSIYEGAAKFGTGLAEFLNGLITPELFYEVGKTIAKFLGTRIQFALNFFQTFDWSNLGESLANGINGFFENFPFGDLAQALNKFVDGLEDALFSFIKNVNWWHVFTGLWDFFTNLEVDTLLVLPMLRAFMKIRKNAGSTFKAMQVIGSKSLHKVGGLFTTLLSDRKTLGVFQSIKVNGVSSFNALRESISKTTKAMMGAGGIIAAFVGTKNAVEGMADGSKSIIAGLGQIAISAGVAGTALYTAFGPWGLAVGAIAGLVGAIVGISKATDEINRKEIALKFSDENGIKLSDLNSELQKNVDLIADVKFPEGYQENLDKIKDSSKTISTSLSTIQQTGILMKNGALDYEEGVKRIKTSLKDLEAATQEHLFATLSNSILLLEANRATLEADGKNVDAMIQEQVNNYNNKLQAYSSANDKFIKSLQKNDGKITTDVVDLIKATAEATGEGTQLLKNNAKKAEDTLKNTKQQFEKNKINLSEYFNKDNELDTKKLEEDFNSIYTTYDNGRQKIKKVYKQLIKDAKDQGLNDLVKTLRKQKNEKLEELDVVFKETVTDPLQAGLNKSILDGLDFSNDNSWSNQITFQNIMDSVGNKVISAYNTTFKNTGTQLHEIIQSELVNSLYLDDNEMNQAAEGLRSNYEDYVSLVSKGLSFSEAESAIKVGLKNMFTNSAENLSLSEMKKMLQEKLENMFGSLGEMRFQLGLQVETPASKVTGNWFNKSFEDTLKNNDMIIKTKMQPLPGYATGGFPEDGLFFANHSELVGQFSNGKTAVANNQQITDGIEEAAYRGYMRALASQGANNSVGGTQRIEIPVVIDGKEITRIVNKNNSRNGAKIMGNETGYVYG